MTDNRARQRRYRRRQRRGQTVYPVSGDHRLLLALIEAGRLQPEDTLDRDRVAGEIAAVVAEWADRWV